MRFSPSVQSNKGGRVGYSIGNETLKIGVKRQKLAHKGLFRGNAPEIHQADHRGTKTWRQSHGTKFLDTFEKRACFAEVAWPFQLRGWSWMPRDCAVLRRSPEIRMHRAGCWL
jgi:ribosomal protein L35